MAGNYGKFIDRSPIICPAGKISGDPNETVALAFKQYKVVDEIDALRHDANIWKEDEFVLPRKLPPIQNPAFKGTKTEISEILCPPVETRYQTLINDLKDTTYTSYWKAQIGKVSDPVPGLPAGMSPLDVTFGKATERERVFNIYTSSTYDCRMNGSDIRTEISVKELVNPSKGPYQVLRESQIGHEMYRKTHNDYNPSEKVDRGYYQPPYNPHKCFGESTKYDPRGIWAKCALDWYMKGPLVHANKFQADYLNRTRPQLGKVLAPNNNIKCVPEGHTFGDTSKQDFYGVEDLLKDPNVEPSVFKRDFNQWLSSLNKFRVLMKERCKKGFSFRDFYKNALYFDQEKCGWLPIDVFYEVCACNHITFPKDDIEALCNHLKYTVDGKINYKKFIDLIDINSDLSDIKPIDDLPNENKYYVSTNQAASCDYLIIDNSDLPAAGIPSIRHDLPRPVPPPGRCRADLENFGDETSAKAVVNPSIYTNYGLTYRDFFMPRPPEIIRPLFEKLGYNFPGESFQKLWDMAVSIDRTGLVCVDTFKRLLQSKCPPLKLRVDEKQIECEKSIL